MVCLETSRNGEVNTRLALENRRLTRENAELTRERDLLRTVIDNLPDYVYAKDKAGRFVLNNPAHAKDLGAKSPQAMKGKTDFDYFPRELAAQYFADEQSIIQSGKPIINQEQFKVSPGDKSALKRWSVSTKVLWRDDQGNVLGTVGITRDITKSKQAEQTIANERALLRTLVDHLPVAIYLKDLAGRKTLANPMELSYAGITSETEILGKADSDLFPPEVAAAYRADDQKVLDSGQAVINREGSFTKPDGSVIWFLTSKVPLRDSAGRVTGLAGINLDITALKEAEARLAKTSTLMDTLLATSDD
jgi:PAS domain S-box-containing protein